MALDIWKLVTRWAGTGTSPRGVLLRENDHGPGKFPDRGSFVK